MSRAMPLTPISTVTRDDPVAWQMPDRLIHEPFHILGDPVDE